MQQISSKDNQKVKDIIMLLKGKKHREEQGFFVVEGSRWINDILDYGGMISSVFVAKKTADNFAAVLEKIKKEIGENNLYCVDDKVFEKLSDTVTSQGILAVVSMKENAVKSALLQVKKILYLDTISDPGNMGSIIRTALAAGFKSIILRNCVDVYSPKVVRSTMGALLKVSLYTETKNNDAISFLYKSKFNILAATLKGKNVFTLKGGYDKIVLVIGSEAAGICDKILEFCDTQVTIPMQGTESLNAAVSAGILMYQLSYSGGGNDGGSQ